MSAPCGWCGGLFEPQVGPTPHRYCSPSCRTTASKARKRQVSGSGLAHRADRIALLMLLLRREGDRCYLCGLVVDLDAPIDHPGQATLDHVYPRSAGGSNRMSNLAVAHLSCNQAKGNAVIPDLWTLPVPSMAGVE